MGHQCAAKRPPLSAHESWDRMGKNGRRNESVTSGERREKETMPLMYPPTRHYTGQSIWTTARKLLFCESVPHQAPSWRLRTFIDAAHGIRTRKEIKDRGRWKSERSVLGYEQRARLHKSFHWLPAACQVYVLRCENVLHRVISYLDPSNDCSSETFNEALRDGPVADEQHRKVGCPTQTPRWKKKGDCCLFLTPHCLTRSQLFTKNFCV